MPLGVVCVILRLAVLVELRLVTDRQTDGRADTDTTFSRFSRTPTCDGRADRRTDRHRVMASTARGCIASRGKNAGGFVGFHPKMGRNINETPKRHTLKRVRVV